MLTIVTDVQITRRKRSHLVLDETSEVQFAAAKLADVLSWLHDNQHTMFMLQDSSGQVWRAELRHVNQALLAVEKEDAAASSLTPSAEAAQPELPLTKEQP